MLVKSLSGFLVLLVAVGLLAAQQAKDKDAKNAKEITAKIIKVDVDKQVITVTMEDGKKKDLNISQDTRIIGPGGNVSQARLKDNRLTPGAEIKLMMGADGKTVKQLQLLPRKGANKSPDKDK
jgi:hypothetical protein